MDVEIDIDEYFPYRKDGKASYRPYQKESIEKAINALFINDYDAFFLDCPVGFGKSGVIVTLARIVSEFGGDSYITTPQIILQEQYKDEFPEIPQIKGRSNYTCAKDSSVKCDSGECQINDKYKCDSACAYRIARDTCINSSVCCMNTSYMLTANKLFGDRKLMLCDEAHSIPEWGIDFVSVTIRESDIGFIPDFNGFVAYVTWLEKHVYPIYYKKMLEFEEYLSFNQANTKRKAQIGIAEAYKKSKNIVNKILLLVSDYETYGEEWQYNIEFDKYGKKIAFKPLTSGRFLNQLLWSKGEKIVLSSATIEPNVYLKESGLFENASFNFKDCVMTVPSEFDPKKSPIYYKGIGKMTKAYKGYTLPYMIKEINKIISDRRDRKGIIHTYTYDNAKYIVDNIQSDLSDLLHVQNKNDRIGSLNNWIESTEPSVFISTNMTEGINLKDELCRYQIYVKVGYPNVADNRVAKRLELGHWLWYSMQAIEDLEQASGRTTRSKDDYSEMFIFDSSFSNLYVRYKKYMKSWFKDRLVSSQV